MVQNFKNKLKNGVVGMFSKTEDPAMIEAMGYGGADFVIIDLEHGPNTIRSAQNLVRAAQLTGMFPIIRTKENNPSVMAEALDIGAGGIQIPQITDKASALEVIKRTKFSPLGERGVCRFVRAAKYSSMDRFEYFEKANQSVIIMQIEGCEGINNLDEILQVEGIDVIFIGPYDLSQSMGVVGQTDHPLVQEKMLEIIEKCGKKGVLVGTFTDTLQNALKWKSLGVKYIAHSVDVGIFYQAIKDTVDSIKN
ncbi:MAG: aldolase [Ruminococcaceae bacterium]|nr:aldolase [Oscillospiraceae bacterium]